MANIVSALNKTNCKSIDIARAEDLDFTDDGNTFRGFLYKGILPLAQCHSRISKQTYLTVQIHNMENNNFTYLEWHGTEEAMLCDEFNGVSQIDLDKLKANLEAILSKVNEMNETASVDEAELENAVANLNAYIRMMKRAIYWAKERFSMWNASIYEIKQVKEYVENLSCEIERRSATLLTYKDLSICEKKALIQRFKNGCPSNYYAEQLKELTDKSCRK